MYSVTLQNKLSAEDKTKAKQTKKNINISFCQTELHNYMIMFYNSLKDNPGLLV